MAGRMAQVRMLESHLEGGMEWSSKVDGRIELDGREGIWRRVAGFRVRCEERQGDVWMAMTMNGNLQLTDRGVGASPGRDGNLG